MAKIGVLSDIHGNVTALEAVIEDSRNQGVTEYWLLGDLVLPGHGDRDLFDLVASLDVSVSVRGNWDDCFLEALDGQYGLEDCEEVYLLKLSQYLSRNISSKHIQTIRETPLHVIREVEGISFSISHNHPDKNWGGDLIHHAPQERIDELFEKYPCDVAVYGHIHEQMLRYSSKGQMLINPGSVGNPYYPWDALRKDFRAQYAILDVNEHGVSISFRKVFYDREKEIEHARQKDLPFFELYTEQIRTSINQTHNRTRLEEIIAREAYIKDLQ